MSLFPLLRNAFLVCFSLVTTSFAGSQIQGPAKKQDSVNGAFTLGYQGSEDLHTGYADVLQPLYSPSPNFAILYDGRFSFDDGDQETHSHGLVFRYRVPDHDLIIGANVYYDSTDSAYGHRYDQLGLGVEVLTKWVDFRANYYLPEQKREPIDTRSEIVGYVNHELALVKVADVFAPGGIVRPIYGLVENVSGQFQRHEFTRFESPLEGLDTELGFLIPGLHRCVEVRVFGGYYHYVNPFGSDLDGFKARLEARLRKGLVAEVEYLEDTKLTGGHWSGGVRVSVPFNFGNIFAGRNPFEGASEAFGPPSEDFGNRMSDMVIRSHRVKTAVSNYVRTKVQDPSSVTISRRADGSILVAPNFEQSGSGLGGLEVSTSAGAVTVSGGTLSVVGSLPAFPSLGGSILDPGISWKATSPNTGTPAISSRTPRLVTVAGSVFSEVT
jgi:hypothetical protein